MSGNGVAGSGVGFSGLLFLLFLGLKLGHVIDWKWIWVFAPLWIGLALGLIILLFAFIFASFGVWHISRRHKRR